MPLQLNAGSASGGRAQQQLPAADAAAAMTTPLVQLMTYIAGCALPPGERRTMWIEAQPHEFIGDLGYAPEWPSRSLSDIQQRKLSACVLARANRSGASVRIELRDAHAVPAELNSVWEGGYFGNLFAMPQTMYACGGTDREDRIAWLLAHARECAIESDEAAHLSRCGFVHVGRCDRQAFVRDGIDYYDSALFVFVTGPERSNEPSDAESAQNLPQRSSLDATFRGESTLLLDPIHHGEHPP